MCEINLRLISRIRFVDFFQDQVKNLELEHSLNIFEKYLFGVHLQYKRISENVAKLTSVENNPDFYSQDVTSQISLDIYYYTLTWDKLKKVFKKIKGHFNVLQKDNNSISQGFKNDYRLIKIKLEHLFKEFNLDTRNEYEHPSLEFLKRDNIFEYGNMFFDPNGNITAHVGKNQFTVVRNDQVHRLKTLWIEFIDIILKNFSDKPSSANLITAKEYIDQNIDNIIGDYDSLIKDNKIDEANNLLSQLLWVEVTLTKEAIPLSNKTISKFHSVYFKKR
ncbi:MAG: hypothetical protein ABSD46_10205 [Bacteroidota bacterium]